MKQKIGLDFDGVIANTNEVKIRLVEEMYGIKLPLYLAKEKLSVASGIITSEQYSDAVNRLYNTDLTLDARPVSGACEVIQQLKKDYDVSIVTSRREKSVEIVRQWCENNGITEIQIIGTNLLPKTQYLGGYYCFVDDDLDKLKPLFGTVKNLFLFSWEYNQSDSLPIDVKRVLGWNEISQLLKI